MRVGGVREDRSSPARCLVRCPTATVGTSERQREDPSAAGLTPGDAEHARCAACPELPVELVERRNHARRGPCHEPTVGFPPVSDIVEQGAIISGIGISRIGRKTGIPGLELTAESSREAITDAGLHRDRHRRHGHHGRHAGQRSGSPPWHRAQVDRLTDGQMGLAQPGGQRVPRGRNASGSSCSRVPDGQHDGGLRLAPDEHRPRRTGPTVTVRVPGPNVTAGGEGGSDG